MSPLLNLDRLEEIAKEAQLEPGVWLSRWWIAELGALPEEQEFIHALSPDVVLELIALVKNGEIR